MKRIKLCGGSYALVDDEDYGWLQKYKWHLNGGYATRTEKNRTIKMHREIMRTPKGKLTDHINQNKLDNRKNNLRFCTGSQNQANVPKINKLTSSPFKGVSWFKRYRKWRVQISVDGIHKHIGYFDNEVHAAIAHDLWAKDSFGEYASTNFRVVQLFSN